MYVHSYEILHNNYYKVLVRPKSSIVWSPWQNYFIDAMEIVQHISYALNIIVQTHHDLNWEIPESCQIKAS